MTCNPLVGDGCGGSAASGITQQPVHRCFRVAARRRGGRGTVTLTLPVLSLLPCATPAQRKRLVDNSLGAGQPMVHSVGSQLASVHASASTARLSASQCPHWHGRRLYRPPPNRTLANRPGLWHCGSHAA